MNTIAVFAAKGGAGKTTLSLHLAVAASHAGRRTAVFDCDVQQRSSLRWGDARRDDLGLEDPYVLSVEPDQVKARRRDAEADGFDLVVIDSPPRVDAKISSILASVDFVLVPVMPSSLDIGALDQTLRLITAGDKRGYLILNGCPPRAREVDEAAEALAHEPVPLAPIRIGYRRAFSRSIASGRTATETEPRGAAAAEIAALLSLVTT